MSAITVQAKDMNHRLGVGPKTPFSVATPAIAIHYFPNQDYAITGALAITTAEDSSQFGLQGGVRRILFEERNLNFFVGGTLGVLSYEVAGTNNSGFELTAVSGGEFFFEGLENLGFNFEMGFGVTSVKSSNTFATIARTPVNAGMIFYF
jgi:hypothetical protein